MIKIVEMCIGNVAPCRAYIMSGEKVCDASLYLQNSPATARIAEKVLEMARGTGT